MELSFAPATLISFLLASTRLLATFTASPPFNGGLIPVRVRVALAVAIAIPLSTTTPATDVPTEIPAIVLALLSQVIVGLIFGFFVQLLMAAFQMAGSIIDLSSGLSAGALYDPVTQSQVAPVGRMYQLVSLALLVALDGHLLIVQGVMRSYQVAPAGIVRTEALGPAFTEGAAQLLIAALEVGFPVLAALMLAEVALAIASRAAPKMNIMAIGFGVKSLVLFFVLGLGLPLMANAVSNLLEISLRSGAGLIGG